MALCSNSLLESVSMDSAESVTPDPGSLTNSLSNPLVFDAIGDDDNEEASASIITYPVRPVPPTTSKLKPPLTKQSTLPSSNLSDSFGKDLDRALFRLETAMNKPPVDSRRTSAIVSSSDSSFVDVRLMVDSEKDCSLLSKQSAHLHGFLDDPVFKSVLEQFDLRVVKQLFELYRNANSAVDSDKAKHK